MVEDTAVSGSRCSPWSSPPPKQSAYKGHFLDMATSITRCIRVVVARKEETLLFIPLSETAALLMAQELLLLQEQEQLWWSLPMEVPRQEQEEEPFDALRFPFYILICFSVFFVFCLICFSLPAFASLLLCFENCVFV